VGQGLVITTNMGRQMAPKMVAKGTVELKLVRIDLELSYKLTMAKFKSWKYKYKNLFKLFKLFNKKNQLLEVISMQLQNFKLKFWNVVPSLLLNTF